MNNKELLEQTIENIERIVNRASNCDITISDNLFLQLNEVRISLIEEMENKTNDQNT